MSDSNVVWCVCARVCVCVCELHYCSSLSTLTVVHEYAMMHIEFPHIRFLSFYTYEFRKPICG